MADRCRTYHFIGCQFLHTQAQSNQLVSQGSLELAVKEKVWNDEFEGQAKYVLDKRAPLQVDDDRGVGDEDTQGSGGSLIQARFQFANRYAEELGRPRLADNLLGQRTVAQPLETPGLLALG